MEGKTYPTCRLALLGSALGIALAIGVHTAWLACASLAPAPFADAYPLLLQVAEHGFRWSDLLEPHNEHVIAIPKFLFVADLHLAAGTGLSLVTMNLVLVAAVPLAFALIAWRGFFARPRDALFYGALVFVAYCNGTQLMSLAWGFMIQHWIAALSVVVTAYGFARLAARESRCRPAWYALAAASAAAAILSVGSGVACLLAAVAVGVTLRLRWPTVLVFAGMALAGLAFQLLLNPPSAERSLGNLAHAPLAALQFYLAYLGGPFLRCVMWPATSLFWEPRPGLAMALGGLLLAAACFLLAREALRRGPRSPFVVFHSVVLVYALGAGVLLTAARLNISVYYGTEPKYAATSLLGWIAIFSLGLDCAAAWCTIPEGWRPAAWAAGLAALLVLVLPAHFRERRVALGWKDLVWDSEAGQVAGVFDPMTLNAFEHQRQRAFQMSQSYLKPFRLSMFHRYAFAMGDRLADHFSPAPAGTCLGSLDLYHPLQPGAGGMAVSGWAWNVGQGAKVRDVLLTDPEGRIVGLAHTTRDRGDVPAVHPAVAVRCGWFGYVRSVPPGTLLSAYALTGAGQACLIGQSPAP